MSGEKSFGIGLVGCGAFGRYCLRAYRQMEDLRIIAAADNVRDNADACAQEFDIPVYDTADELIARKDIDIVHIATPPSTHHDIVMRCCEAHKHALCEKPLAMNVQEADEMLASAAGSEVIVPVNFVLRYNEVTRKVKQLLDSGLLGAVLSGRLTNCATDSHLPKGHWFWDKAVSGGIFIEHGVHFFDLYRYWLGGGQVVSALTVERPRTHQEDRVTCVVLHDSGAVVSHFHSFDQIAPLDRTDHRIITELGDIQVNGWIPLSLAIDAVLDERGCDQLKELLGECRIDSDRALTPEERKMPSRGKPRQVTRRIQLTYTPNSDKQAVYSNSVRLLMADQLAYLRDRAHNREVTEENGRQSLAMAQQAAELATGACICNRQVA